MKLTIKINDALCREARHRAVDQGLPLAGWIADLLRRELMPDVRGRAGLLDALAMKEGEEQAFGIERDLSSARDLSFSE